MNAKQCACCGGNATGVQWPNRDTGYSVCSRCFACVARKEGYHEAVRIYGVPGVNHSVGESFAVAEGLTCIDLVMPDGRTSMNKETIEEVRVRYPKAELVELMEWTAKKEKTLCTEPEEITKARFIEMLEVLPPQQWQRGKDCESFELCEHTSGRVTAIFCRFGEKYYEFQGIAGQSLATHATHCGQMKVIL